MKKICLRVRSVAAQVQRELAPDRLSPTAWLSNLRFVHANKLMGSQKLSVGQTQSTVSTRALAGWDLENTLALAQNNVCES